MAGRVLCWLAVAALLWVGGGREARAQATVLRGEVSGFFVIPFANVPDDPEVMVFADLLLDGRLIFSPSGAAHLGVDEVKAIEWSRVSGENYRYQLAQIQMQSTHTDNLKGHLTSSARLTVTLIRIDRATSQPIAMITGEGRVHISADLEREHLTQVDRMTWTVSPLP